MEDTRHHQVERVDMIVEESRSHLTVGVPKSSLKPHEKRLPLHPTMLGRVPQELREYICFEEGYGAAFGVSDEELIDEGFKTSSREAIYSESDVILLPKPTPSDLTAMRPGSALWGWPHCVQDPAITQAAIDNGVTLIAFEQMFEWLSNGQRGCHTFHTNNEIAGYSSVTHALQLNGETGAYGPPKSAAIIGFGATGEGALKPLISQGVSEVYVLSRRSLEYLPNLPDGVHFRHLTISPTEEGVVWDGNRNQLLKDFLATCDVIANCTLQDPKNPLIFLDWSDLQRLRNGTLIVDIACDTGMGFSWARATSFTSPTFHPRPGVTHYAVGHSPSLYWRSATWELSEAILPFLPTVINGPEAWEGNETLRRAIEIYQGTVRNENILTFQERESAHPHQFTHRLIKAEALSQHPQTDLNQQTTVASGVA